jgi:hypothetical protein
MKFSRTFAFVCLVGATLAPSAAFALAKTMPASACQKPVETANMTSLGRGANFAYTLAGDLSLSCSLLRDNTTNTNGLSALQVVVSKNDANARSCSVYAYDGYGNLLKAVGRTVSGTGLKTFDWTNSLNVSSANGAYYTVLCDLGPYDVGVSVYWNEPTPGLGNDVKTFPGGYCKPDYGEFFLTHSVPGLTGTSTFSDHRYIMVCPMLRDTFSSTRGLQAVNVRMYHGDTIQSDCQGIIADRHDNYVKSVVRSVTQVGNATLSFGTSLNVLNTATYYALECGMGQNDIVYSVEYAE